MTTRLFSKARHFVRVVPSAPVKLFQVMQALHGVLLFKLGDHSSLGYGDMVSEHSQQGNIENS